MATVVSKGCFFLVFLCFALLLMGSGQSGAEQPPQDHVKTSSTHPEWKIAQGPCSKFPECNKYCLSLGYPLGGSCGRTAPQSSLYCLCGSN